MNSRDIVSAAVERLLITGSRKAGVEIRYAIDTAPSQKGLRVVVVSEALEGVAPGERFKRVWEWLKLLGRDQREQINTLALLTDQEVVLAAARLDGSQKIGEVSLDMPPKEVVRVGHSNPKKSKIAKRND